MYVRDKRSPVPKSEAVSRVMSANRAKNTKPELLLRQALYQAGARGYRLHYRVKLPQGSPPYEGGVSPASGRRGGSLRLAASVRPDISFVSKKLAIFVNGCYWHRCPKCNYTIPKTNTTFWQTKFANNIVRDERKRKELRRRARMLAKIVDFGISEYLSVGY
ncbi:MAG: very short patch repair endonuclease [Pyrinomonadaceae bacterium]